jgi:tetratricopeptide (TPR) repeat protein
MRDRKETEQTAQNLRNSFQTIQREVGSLLKVKAPSPRRGKRTSPSRPTKSHVDAAAAKRRAAELFMVPHRNPSFVGREKRIKEVHDYLWEAAAGPRSLVLWGLGGIGKSQIALEYAHKYKDGYGACLWITCDSSTKISEDVSQIVPKLNLEATGARQDNANLKYWLQTTGKECLLMEEPGCRFAKMWTDTKWLLVFDNAESPLGLKDLWPDSTNGHIIITTQDKQWSSPEYTTRFIPIKMLTEEEAIEMLIRHFKVHDRTVSKSDAISLGRASKGLPLALYQFASYIIEQEMEVSEFLEDYQNNSSSLRVDRWKNPSALQYQHTLGTFLNVAFKKLSTDSIKIMAVISLLDGDVISERFLLDSEDGQSMGKVADFHFGIDLLCRYSLVSKIHDKSGRCYNVHRQVKRHTLNRLSNQDLGEASTWVMARLRRLIPRQSPFAGEVTGNLHESLGSIKHLLALKNALKALKFTAVDSTVLASLYVDGAVDIWAQGLLEDCQGLTSQALEICESTTLHASLVSQIYSFHASVRSELGHYEEGEKYFLASRDVIQDHIDSPGSGYTLSDNALLANAWNNLAGVYYSMKRYKKAERCNTMSLNIKNWLGSKRQPVEHLLCLTYLNMANTYKRQGKRDDEAAEYFGKAIEVAAGSPTSKARQALAHHNFGLLRLEQGLTENAKNLFLEATELRKEALGDHPDTAISLYMLACCSHAEKGDKNLEEALGLLQDAQRIFEDFQTNVHPTYMPRLLFKMSLIQKDLNRTADAAELRKQSRELFTKANHGKSFPQNETEFDHAVPHM